MLRFPNNMADLFAPVTLGPLLATTTPLEPDLRQDAVAVALSTASSAAATPQSDLSVLELVLEINLSLFFWLTLENQHSGKC